MVGIGFQRLMNKFLGVVLIKENCYVINLLICVFLIPSE